jgi:tetratricopeptide (TPR) repeat protein
MQQGGKAAIAAAHQVRTARATALDEAGQFLIMIRHYDLARELLASTGTLAQPTAQATLWKSVKRRPATHDRKDPRTATRAMFGDILDPDPASGVYWDDETRDEIVKANATPAATREAIRKIGEELWSDFVHTVIDVQIDGPKGGPWRATYDVLGKRGNTYIALDRGVAKVIGAQDAIEGLGRHAQRDTAHAAQLLDWARSEVDAGHTKHDRFPKLWGGNLPRDAKAMAVASAVLAGTRGARTVLTACATTAPDARAECDAIIGFQLWKENKWAELEKQTQTSSARDAERMSLRALALARLNKFDEADKMISDVLAKFPKHQMASFLRFDVAVGRGNATKVRELIEADLRQGTPVHGTKNNYAWYLLGEGKDIARALEVARQAALESADKGFVINTLGAVAAEAGDLQTAVKSGDQSMTLANRKVPSSADWLLYATIYEKLALRADAIAAYKKVRDDEKSSSAGRSSHDIARARLARMGVK